jgi:hypothetical protein
VAVHVKKAAVPFKKEQNSMKKPPLWDLLQKVHEDEEGSVSLETILIVGAVAIPIMIFLYKVAFPKIQTYFNSGLDSLQQPQDVPPGT